MISQSRHHFRCFQPSFSVWRTCHSGPPSLALPHRISGAHAKWSLGSWSHLKPFCQMAQFSRTVSSGKSPGSSELLPVQNDGGWTALAPSGSCFFSSGLSWSWMVGASILCLWISFPRRQSGDRQPERLHRAGSMKLCGGLFMEHWPMYQHTPPSASLTLDGCIMKNHQKIVFRRKWKFFACWKLNEHMNGGFQPLWEDMNEWNNMWMYSGGSTWPRLWLFPKNWPI